MTSVRNASAVPLGLVALIVYSPTSSSTTFLMVNVADSSLKLFSTRGDGLMIFFDVDHSTSGSGLPPTFTVNVTSSFSLTLYTLFLSSITIVGGVFRSIKNTNMIIYYCQGRVIK